jgi:hypothetical protein
MDTGMNSPMRNAIVHEVETAVSNTKQDLLNSMAVLIDSRLDTFQSNIQQSDFQISKIEESVTDNFRFQRNGNENQYKHSVKVMSKLKEARSILENPDMNSQKVVAAKEKISEGIGIVQERQKLADTSDLGWKVVQEYERNPIAYVSEDEKRTNRALSKAERKSKSEKANMRLRTTPYHKERSAAEDNAGKYKPGRCYTCGKRDHWSDGCPDSKISKISTFVSLFNSGIILYQSQINTTESKINLFNTNILKLSGHFNDSISQSKTVKVDQIVNNTIEVHTSVKTPVGI